MTHVLVLLGAWAATTIELQVQPVAGPAVSGQLAALDSQRLVLRTAEGELPLAPDELFWAAPEKPPKDKPAPAALWIELTDGSGLAATGYTVDRGLAKVQLAGGPSVDVRTRLIRTVLLKNHAQEPGLAEQWAKIVARQDRPGDLLIIRRTVEKPIRTEEGESVQKEHSLDYVDGVLYNVTPETVQFELDGELNDVPRSRVEGLAYYHPRGEKLAEPMCRVTDAFGSVWSAAALAWQADVGRLTIKTVAGVETDLAAGDLRRLDFSVGKMQYLSDLEPAAVEFTARRSGGATDANFGKFYAYKRDRALLDDGPLLVQGQAYRKGLALASRTVVTYLLPEGHRRFRALAAIDDRAQGQGNVDLVILGDGRELARYEIDGAGPPERLDIDIAGVRRLTLRVEWGKYGDRNDDLDLCEARITK